MALQFGWKDAGSSQKKGTKRDGFAAGVHTPSPGNAGCSHSNKRSRQLLKTNVFATTQEEDDLEREEAECNRKVQGHQFRVDGDRFAEGAQYRQAMSMWEQALMCEDDPGVRARLLEQQTQVLLELGDMFGAVKKGTEAVSLLPAWATAHTTLARAQLNYGEPGLALQSASTALFLDPTNVEMWEEMQSIQAIAKEAKTREVARGLLRFQTEKTVAGS